MVVEAAVLVVDDQQHRLVPASARDHVLDDVSDELLAGCHVGGRPVAVPVGRILDVVRVEERDARKRARKCARVEPELAILRAEDVLVVERVTLEEAQGAVAVLEVGPTDERAVVRMARFGQVVEDRRCEHGPHRARVVELPEAA